jgi:hypothetical protein
MRKITKESSEAFVNLEYFKKSNTEISAPITPNWDDWKEGDEFVEYDAVSAFYLHGNLIAFMDETGRMSNKDRHGRKSGSYRKESRTIESRKVKIDLCGWHTPTTRERINGILDALGYDFGIAQRNYEQVLVRNRRWKFHDNGGWEESYSQDILKLSDDSFDPEFAKKVFNSSEFVSGTDLNAITDF